MAGFFCDLMINLSTLNQINAHKYMKESNYGAVKAVAEIFSLFLLFEFNLENACIFTRDFKSGFYASLAYEHYSCTEA